jgi:hypothetical protein
VDSGKSTASHIDTIARFSDAIDAYRPFTAILAYDVAPPGISYRGRSVHPEDIVRLSVEKFLGLTLYAGDVEFSLSSDGLWTPENGFLRITKSYGDADLPLHLHHLTAKEIVDAELFVQHFGAPRYELPPLERISPDD